MLTVLLALASLACLVLGVHYLRQALAVTGTATSYIRSAAQGYVVLVGEGTPLPGRSIVAPYSGKACLWWATQTESGLVQQAEAVNSQAFNRRTSSDAFLLKDGTGECFVDPDLAEVHAITRQFWYGSSLDMSPLGNLHSERKLGDDIRYVEERIELHQRIVARGYFHTAHADPGAVPPPPARPASVAPGTPILGEAPDGRRFVLSTVREDVLAKRLRLRAALALLLCAVLAGCALLTGG